MNIRKEIDFGKGLTPEQKRMLEEMEVAPIEFDEDCPELTTEQLLSLRRASQDRRAEQRKQTISLRLSPKTLEKARSLGSGYTTILAEIIETALNSTEN